MREVTTETGGYYRAYRESLAYAADFLAPLQEKDMVVLLELFNEFNGDWNWMGKCSAKDFQELWRYTFGYFAKDRKFKNLLFVLEFSAGCLQREGIAAQDYFPGRDQVDLLGFDFYHDDPQDTYKVAYDQLLALGKPLAMTEFGPDQSTYRRMRLIDWKSWPSRSCQVWDNMVQADFTKRHYPRCCFFIRWSADWAISSQKNAKEFMADPWWVDLERLKKDAPAGGWRK